MNHSLRRHLCVVIAGTIVAGGMAAATTSAGLAYFEAREFQDDLLRQVAAMGARSPPATKANRSTQGGTDGAPLSDPESRIVVFRVPGDERPDWLAAGLPAGFHTLAAREGTVRVYVYADPAAGRIVAAQSTASRDELALTSALHGLVPMLLLLPMLVWLVVRIVRNVFAPLAGLASRLDDQPADRPEPIPEAGLPDEIIPFVQAGNRLLQRVNEGVRQQRRFIADASHELCSPLTALALQAQNVRQAESPAAMRDRLAPLEAGIERARRLTGQLLSLARVQGRSGPQNPIDLGALARELIAQFLPDPDAGAVELALESDVRVPVVGSDEELRQIMGNGLENAIRYSPRGSTVVIRITNEEHAAVVVEILDEGPGILLAQEDRVFEPFFRVPGSVGNGSGLGLAIAREAADRLGGEVSLRSSPARPGSVFRYRQPNATPRRGTPGAVSE